MDQVQSLLLDIIRGIVNYPEEVKLSAVDNEHATGKITMINISVNQADIGTCIGQGGQTAEAIRKIIGLIGFRATGQRIYVNVDAPKRMRN